MTAKRKRAGSTDAADSGHTGHPVTMRDVAEAAGVSVATVSNVVNDKPERPIGADARQRVHDAVSDLGYRPNALAKTLSSGSSKFIGLVADAIATTPFAGQIIHGAQDEAWKHGFVLLVANTDGNPAAEEAAIAMMLEHQVRGILYSTWYHREIVAPPEALRETDYVLVDCFAAGSGLPAVVPDEVQGGRHRDRAAARSRPPADRVHQHHLTVSGPVRRLAGTAGARGRDRVRPALVLPASPGPGGRLRGRRPTSSTRGHRGVLPQRPRRHGPVRRPARARAAHPRRHRHHRVRQPGRHRRPPPSHRCRPSRFRTTNSAPPACVFCSG